MRVTITKIYELRSGQLYSGVPYHRVELATEDGAWAHTDLVPSFRNFRRWHPFAVGSTYDGVRLLKGSTSKVDADSPATRSGAPPLAHKPRPAPPAKPKDPQLSFF